MKNHNTIDYFIYFLLFLIPLGFIFSIVALEIIFFLYLITFIFIGKKNFFFWDKIDKNFKTIFLILTIYLIINSIINIKNDPYILKSFFYFRYYILILFFIFLNEIFNFKYFKFIKLFTFVLFILSIDVIFQSIFSFNILGYKISADYTFSRISGFFSDEYILGSFLFNFSWLIFIFFFKNNNKSQNIIVFAIITAAIVLTGERSATFKYILFLTLIFIFFCEMRLFLIKSSLLSFLIFMLTIFTQFNYSYETYYKNSKKIILDQNSIITITNIFDRYYFIPIINDLKFLKVKNYNNESEKNKIIDLKKEIINNFENKNSVKDIAKKPSYYFLSDHLGLFKNALLIFKHNPVFGTGIKTFRNVCYGKKYEFTDDKCSTHPHNYYIEILSELGIIGLILFLILIFSIIKIKFIEENKKYKTLMIIFILCFLFPFQTTGSFFNNYTSIIFYLILSGYFYLSRNRV